MSISNKELDYILNHPSWENVSSNGNETIQRNYSTYGWFVLYKKLDDHKNIKDFGLTQIFDLEHEWNLTKEDVRWIKYPILNLVRCDFAIFYYETNPCKLQRGYHIPQHRMYFVKSDRVPLDCKMDVSFLQSCITDLCDDYLMSSLYMEFLLSRFLELDNA